MRPPKQKQLAPIISLSKLSNRSRTIRSLVKQAENRTSFEEIFNQVLPEAFKNKFKLNSTENGILTISCQSASLMTKFRFSQDKVLTQLNNRIYPRKITNIKIKIRPRSLHARPLNTKDSKKPVLSKKNAQLLVTEAEHTDNLGLKEILLKLAKHEQEDSQ